MKKNLLLFMGLVMGFLIILTLRPIDTSIEHASSIEAIVDSIGSNEGAGDISLHIKGSDIAFCVNQGTSFGMQNEVLSSLMEGKAALIHYADHFTPLDPFGRHRYIIQISLAGSVIFDENRDPHFILPH
ncbi:MAG: hypothetical protein HQ500_08875 [Flavobacteriales bacterium]|nr:hypothetical protein [Flavobacteriales bacterium]